jgi:hypothetical protein
MDVGETRQPCFLVERDRIITRLNNENRHPILDWQAVAPIRAGANDFAAIRNKDTANAGIAGLPLPPAGSRFEDGALNGLYLVA